MEAFFIKIKIFCVFLLFYKLGTQIAYIQLTGSDASTSIITNHKALCQQVFFNHHLFTEENELWLITQ